MRRLFLLLSLFLASSIVANGQSHPLLQRVSRHYAEMGRYDMSFVLRVAAGEQKGLLMVEGDDSYMRVGDTEIYVADSLRYEVRREAKEVVVDKAALYEKDLLNPTNGFASIVADYNVEECELSGAKAVRLTPKRSGETIYVVLKSDRKSIAKVEYGVGEHSAVMIIESCQRSSRSLPRFSNKDYKGYELIDFR
jgi:outer membrane lipoprotein-sorting protein